MMSARKAEARATSQDHKVVSIGDSRYMSKKKDVCAWCRRRIHSLREGRWSPLTATRDHIRPKWLGGGRCVWACWECNQLRGGLPISEWRQFMQENPQWWVDKSRMRALGKELRELETRVRGATPRKPLYMLYDYEHDGEIVDIISALTRPNRR